MSHRKKKIKLWTQDPICYVCDEVIVDMEEATLEHIIPRSKGGSNKNYNIALSHRICNEIKADLILRQDWRERIELYKKTQEMILRSTPPMDNHTNAPISNSV
jgi:5-methylcytosine-specific restriction endonuclease McrA